MHWVTLHSVNRCPVPNHFRCLEFHVVTYDSSDCIRKTSVRCSIEVAIVVDLVLDCIVVLDLMRMAVFGSYLNRHRSFLDSDVIEDVSIVAIGVVTAAAVGMMKIRMHVDSIVTHAMDSPEFVAAHLVDGIVTELSQLDCSPSYSVRWCQRRNQAVGHDYWSMCHCLCLYQAC